MKRLSVILLLIFGFICRSSVLTGQIKNPDPGFIYDDTSLPRIDITIQESDLDALYSDPFSNIEYRADFRFTRNGTMEEVKDVGIRLRGNTSRSKYKKAFKVSFNTFVPGRDFHNLEKLNLNAETNDPSMLRSKLSWELFRYLGVPACRVNHVLLYINSNFYGVYINTEHIDEKFIGSRFGNNDGNLYKCLWPADLTFRGEDYNAYKFEQDGRRAYELHTNVGWDDYRDIADLITDLKNAGISDFTEIMEPIINIQQYLKVMAVDIMIGNWDGYIGNQNNYYLYRDEETGRFEYIPYDLDNTFGIDWLNLDWTERSIYNWDRDERPLYEKILSVDKYKAQFTNYIVSLAGFMESAEFNDFMARIKEQIRPWVILDPFYPLDWGYSFGDFDQSLTVPYGGHVKYSIKDYISKRIASAEAESIHVDPFPVISYADFRALEDTVVITWVVEDNLPGFTTSLHYRLADNEWESRIVAQPAGTISPSNLPVFRDTVYGSGEIYNISIYLETKDASGQSTRYPLNDYTINYPLFHGPLFINEFMASNTEYLADEYGDFDDWVEIYNGGNSAIDLQNYCLSDDNGDPGKYRFPDQYLDPGNYFKVWLDGQPEQGQDHASFRISKDGELLRLSGLPSTGYRIIDLVLFGPQPSDFSFGREIDGGGPWIYFNQPTPGFSNLLTSVKENGYMDELSIYPNPVRTGLIHFSRVVTGILIDQSGRIVMRIRNADSVDISGYDPGLYLVRDDSGFTARFIIIR